jgi:hypothetical protein
MLRIAAGGLRGVVLGIRLHYPQKLSDSLSRVMKRVFPGAILTLARQEGGKITGSSGVDQETR